jgi:hypothetical protein
VNDSFGVCRVQRVRNLNAQIEDRLQLQRLASDSMPECLSFKQFHGDKGPPVSLVNLMNRADVRMIESRGSLRFALETAERLRGLIDIVGEELERHQPTELYILCLEDHTHPSATEFLDDAVVRDGLTDHWDES